MTSTRDSSSVQASGRLINHPTPAPTRKVGYGAAAGAVNTIVLWIIATTMRVEIPAEVASAMTVVLMFVASYTAKHRNM